jgi:hypothetical protein
LRLPAALFTTAFPLCTTAQETTLLPQARALAEAQARRIVRFVDRIPEVVDFALPDIATRNLVRLHVNPKFGDLVRRDYLRVPIGVRTKARGIEGSLELQSYITHGLAGSAGYGFSGLLLGAKREVPILPDSPAAFSAGANFSTPLSRPPRELTDGFRHTIPYVAATFPLLPMWAVTGYATVGADLIAGTSIVPNFGHNQLHSNALTVSIGGAREIRGAQASVTVTHANSGLVSDESRKVTTVSPGVIVPVERWSSDTTRVLLTFGASAVWGPDGRDLGIRGGVRLEFDLLHDDPPPAPARD